MVALGASVCICALSVHNVWSKWRTNPIIINFDSKYQPIDNVPFPSVTICPVTRSLAKKFNFTAVYRAMLKLDGDNSRDASPDEYTN